MRVILLSLLIVLNFGYARASENILGDCARFETKLEKLACVRKRAEQASVGLDIDGSNWHFDNYRWMTNVLPQTGGNFMINAANASFDDLFYIKFSCFKNKAEIVIYNEGTKLRGDDNRATFLTWIDDQEPISQTWTLHSNEWLVSDGRGSATDFIKKLAQADRFRMQFRTLENEFHTIDFDARALKYGVLPFFIECPL